MTAGALTATAAFGENGAGPAAEFTVSEALLRSLSVTTQKTTPYVEDGNYVQPNVTMTAGFRLGNADGKAVTVLDLSMTGTAVTHSSQAVGRRGRHHVNVAATTSLNANFAQEIELSVDGLRGGPLRGSPNITLQGVSASNTFRAPLVRRIVQRATLRQAPDRIAPKLVEKEGQVRAQTAAGIEQALANAGGALDRVLGEIQSQLATPSAFPFEPTLTSRSGGALSMRFEAPGARAPGTSGSGGPSDAASVAPKPGPQAAASTVLHEDFLVRSVTPQIAGKELRLSELRGVLCIPPEKPLLDFCAEWPKDGQDMSILFDATEPIVMKFEDGKIRLQLNAIYRTLSPASPRAVAENDRTQSSLLATPVRLGGSGPLFREARDEGVQFQTQPYSIDLTYRLGKDGATLERLAVRDRTPPATPRSGAAGGNTHDGAAVTTKAADWSRALLSRAVKTQIETAVRRGVRERIEFPSVAFPTRLAAPEPGSTGGALRVLEAGGLFPLETRAENGFLVMSQYFCREGQPGLGVNYRPTPGALVLSAVKPGSPAEAAGLRPGDRVETYAIPGERAVTAGVGPDGFGAFTATRARGADAESRTVILTGRTADGRPFERRVTVCPADGTLRERAEALLRTAQR
jgi:hypothetical protein